MVSDYVLYFPRSFSTIQTFLDTPNVAKELRSQDSEQRVLLFSQMSLHFGLQGLQGYHEKIPHEGITSSICYKKP